MALPLPLPRRHHHVPSLSCASYSRGACSFRRITFPSHSVTTLQRGRLRAATDEQGQAAAAPQPILVVQDDKPTREVEQSVQLLKRAAKTRQVPPTEIICALDVIEKAKIDPSGFLETLGGTESPGRTWMLIFTAEKQLNGGRYFPNTAIQRFDATAKQIENGVFFGPIGYLTFEGRFSWKKRILAFIFERLKITLGPLQTFEISLRQNEDKEPTTKDPFFIWFYVDEEIAVAKGRGGGTAFWCRCRRANSF
uniref:Microbial collagenase n=1 Tax=Kalanchoe fedtschenkoi TaxID=63787 RepID=A0A7N0T7S0_KALFE